LTLADFLVWLEGSALGYAMRNSGLWTYGVVNLAHIIGVATLFGSILMLDLKLLGLWRSIPLASLSRPAATLGAAGFILALITGLGLLATQATEYIGNPFFYIKFPAIALGLVNVLLIHRSAAWVAHRARDLSAREERQLAGMGGVSLLCWLTALSTGRMIGYW
jgi:hypothetical protein